MAVAGTELEWGDILVIIGYFVVVIAVGIASSCRNRGSVGGYFLAGRSMHWIPVGLSLFASNIGSGHFVGLAGSGASNGIGVAVFELNAIFILMLLGWLFVPVYVAAGVFTMPEYLKKRFGGSRIRVYLSVLALLLYVFTKISADLFSGALFILRTFKGFDLYLAIIILLIIAALFTITGGLTAVIWTDSIQVLIMVIGAFILMVMSFVRVGGYEEVVRRFFEAYPNTTLLNYNNASYPYWKCGIPPENSMNLVRAYDDGSLPWPGIFFGLTISSVWYWCSDQVIVQRALAAKNIANAKAGTILAGYLKFTPLFLIVFPGMMSRILFPDTVGCADPDICERECGSRSGCTNIAYPDLVIEVMPAGLRGLMLSVMMSALISSLTSIFNSTSTIFTIDIYKRIRTHANDVELMIVGRLCVLVLVGISIAWIPVVQNVSELFHYIQAITSFLAPPVCAVYVLAVFWKRTNEPGAFYGLMIGLVVGLTRFIWEYAYSVPACGESGDIRPDIIKKVHYLHFGIILFAIVFFCTIIISLLTPPIPEKCLHRLTFWGRFDTAEREDIDAEKDQKELENRKHKVAFKNFAHVEEGQPIYKTALQWICGVEKMEAAIELTEEQQKALERKQNSIHESKNQKIVTSVNAVILMTLAVFLWGFYA